MKNRNLKDKKWTCAALVALCLTALSPVMAEELARDPFIYFTGSTVDTLQNWTGANDPLAWYIVDGSLSYTDGNGKTITSPGRKIFGGDTVDGNAQGRFEFASQEMGFATKSVYGSFLIRCTVLPAGDNWIQFWRGVQSGGGDGNRGRLHAQLAGAGYELGVRVVNGGSTTYNTTAQQILLLNETYMVVTRYDMNPGSDEDNELHLWVNPLLDSAEPPPYASDTNDEPRTDRELDQIDTLGIRRDVTGTDNGNWEYDDIRVGTTWEDVTSSVPAPTDTEAPETDTVWPGVNAEVYGTLNAVSVDFTEGVAGVTAGLLTVDGSAAAAVRDIGGGTHLFTGFAAVSAGTTATIELSTGAIVDASNNGLVAGAVWDVSVLPTPTGTFYTEHFDYANGLLLRGNSVWGGADNPIGPKEHIILNGDAGGDGGTASLQYAGLSNLSKGGRLHTLEVGNDNLEMQFPRLVGEGSVAYASCLLKHVTAGEDDDYIFYFATDGSQSGGIGWLNFEITTLVPGIAMDDPDDGGLVTVPTKPLAVGTTAFIVMKYTIIPGPDNDTVSLWVNPVPGGVEPAADAMGISNSNPLHHNEEVNPAAGIQGVGIRPRNDSGQLYFDGVRFGTTWASVTADVAVDSTAPTVLETFPAADSTVIGSITHVEVTFDESVSVVNPGLLTVNGSPATTLTTIIDRGRPTGWGPYVFTGFTPVTAAGTVSVALSGTGVSDPFGNALASGNWTFTLADPPADGLLLYEGFDYANDSALSDDAPWWGDVPAANQKILSGNPSTANIWYPNLDGITGGRVVNNPLAPNVLGAIGSNLPLSTPVVGDSSVLYFSYALLGTGAPGDDFITRLNTIGSDSGSLVRVRVDDENAPAYTIGAQIFEDATIVLESGAGHAVDEPIFVVGKLTMAPGRDNDSLKVWVNPTLGKGEALGGVESVSVAEGDDGDVNPAHGVDMFVLRTNRFTGPFDIDELRIGTTWEAVTPAESVVLVPASAAHWLLYEK